MHGLRCLDSPNTWNVVRSAGKQGHLRKRACSTTASSSGEAHRSARSSSVIVIPSTPLRARLVSRSPNPRPHTDRRASFSPRFHEWVADDHETHSEPEDEFAVAGRCILDCPCLGSRDRSWIPGYPLRHLQCRDRRTWVREVARLQLEMEMSPTIPTTAQHWPGQACSKPEGISRPRGVPPATTVPGFPMQIRHSADPPLAHSLALRLSPCHSSRAHRATHTTHADTSAPAPRTLSLYVLYASKSNRASRGRWGPQ